MLEMTRQTGQFINFNPRTEKHGQGNVPGADLKISIAKNPPGVEIEDERLIPADYFTSPAASAAARQEAHRAGDQGRLRRARSAPASGRAAGDPVSAMSKRSRQKHPEAGTGLPVPGDQLQEQ